MKGPKGDPGPQGPAGPPGSESSGGVTKSKLEDEIKKATINVRSFFGQNGRSRSLEPGYIGVDDMYNGFNTEISLDYNQHRSVSYIDLGTRFTTVLRGPGRPDIPSTTSGVITSLHFNNPPGTIYVANGGREHSTFKTLGAMAWRKLGKDKWKCIEGDTGWFYYTGDQASRNIKPGTGGYILRRINNTVYFGIYAANNDFTIVNKSFNYTFNIPGFNPDESMAELFTLQKVIINPANANDMITGDGQYWTIRSQSTLDEDRENANKSRWVYEFDFQFRIRGVGNPTGKTFRPGFITFETNDNWPKTIPTGWVDKKPK